MSKTPWLALAGGAATAVLWLFLPLAAPLPLFLTGFGLGLGPALIGAATALVILALMGGSLGVLYAAAVARAGVATARFEVRDHGDDASRDMEDAIDAIAVDMGQIGARALDVDVVREVEVPAHAGVVTAGADRQDEGAGGNRHHVDRRAGLAGGTAVDRRVGIGRQDRLAQGAITVGSLIEVIRGRVDHDRGRGSRHCAKSNKTHEGEQDPRV